MVYLVIGSAGMIGAILRYYVGIAVHPGWVHSFPLGTLLINYVGCFVLGWFTTWAPVAKLPSWFRAGFGTGLIGSFTTFSTFSVETVVLIRQGLWGSALLYVLLSLWGGLILAWSGYKLADSIKMKAGERI